MTEPDAVRVALGAYVLGALPGAERADVETHLTGCAPCREELAGLAGLPGLLAQLDATDVQRLDTLPPPPQDSLVERAVQELHRHRHEQRRRGRVRTAVAALAVAAAAAAGLTVVLFGQTEGRAPVFGPTVSASNPHTGVQAALQLSAQRWGTAMHLTLRGVPPGTHCTLVAVLADGRRQVSGSWQASYEGTASITAAADARLEQLTGVQVVDARGATVVSIPLSGR